LAATIAITTTMPTVITVSFVISVWLGGVTITPPPLFGLPFKLSIIAGIDLNKSFHQLEPLAGGVVVGGVIVLIVAGFWFDGEYKIGSSNIVVMVSWFFIIYKKSPRHGAAGFSH